MLCCVCYVSRSNLIDSVVWIELIDCSSFAYLQGDPATSDYPFTITIDYKQRGWNPAA